MSKHLIYALVIIGGFLVPKSIAGQNYRITVTVTGLHNNKGKVIFYLYNSAEGYPQQPNKAFRASSSVIANNTCTVVFSHIPKGDYAIGCFHDENDNGKLDTNFLGIPNEGVGASNNAKGFMGPPKFRDAKFTVENDVTMPITISY